MYEELVNYCPATLQGSSASLFLTLINALVASKCSFKPEDQYPRDFGPTIKDGDSFDFIIVGAGSAGSVVASRLSENSNWRVLLVEAGTYPSSTSEIPSLVFSLRNSSEDWKYEYEPSEYLRFKDKTPCPRGKGFGGSSLINYMIYFRGNRYDYDSWAQAGNEGWDFDSVLPFYKKFENIQNEDYSRFGNQGELKITKFMQTEPVVPSIVNAYKMLGYNHDYDEEKPLGTLSGYFTIGDGRRYHTGKAFLGKNAKDRPNLFLVLNAQVSKVLIDSTLIVKGVEMRINDKLIKVYATHEVILSAGSVNTPQILMNSGIGPKEHLEDLDIKVVKDLKVGENLRDHIIVPRICYKLDKSALDETYNGSNIDAIYEYFMHRKGKLSKLSENFYAFVNPKKSSVQPTLHIYHSLHPHQSLTLSGFALANSYSLPTSVTDAITKANDETHIAELTIELAYPKSIGKVMLRSKNPFDYPLIFTNYLSNNQDVIDLIDGIRFIQKLMKMEPLQAYNPEFVKFDLADCQEFRFDTDEYWDCVIRNFVRTLYHLVGTCKMGPENDPDAVVDSRLRVYGIKNLRVVDGSIMPSMVGVNTNGPIILIGEKGSHMIKEDWAIKNDEL